MDYEKAYTNAVARAKQAIKDCGHNEGRKRMIEDIFPELAESEDERIRKILREIIIDYDTNNEILIKEVGISQKQFLAWLEKQGEQKPIDKVEPKFKIDDLITDGEYIWKVTNIKRLDYILQSQNGDIVDDTISYVDEYFHLWNIEDAKDGDILADVIDKRPFIFKGLLDKNHPNCPVAYCGIDLGHNFKVSDDNSWWTYKMIKPATKEQYDLLFFKMKEAGYEWDAEKKELRKIDDYCKENCKGYQETGKCFADGECKAKRDAEQKLAWSEEDEYQINTILHGLDLKREIFRKEGNKVEEERYNTQYNWLKSLKPQPHWKPTEEQMIALKIVKNGFPSDDLDAIKSLYNDLKNFEI